MPSTDSLPGAIVAAFQGDGGCTTAMPGGIWQGEAEEQTALPYCELETAEGGSTLLTSSKQYVETVPVTFMAWAVGLTAAEGCGDALLALFNRSAPFAFATAKLLSFLQRGPYQPRPTEKRDQNGNVVYSLAIKFEAQVQRSKP